MKDKWSCTQLIGGGGAKIVYYNRLIQFKVLYLMIKQSSYDQKIFR